MIFHKFTLSDVEDPEIYAAGPILDWQKSEMGTWVMEHCSDTAYQITTNYDVYGYQVVIYGNLSDEDATYFTLKYK
jgi:hypothetical protein